MKQSDLKVGDILIADGGFTCLQQGEEVIVHRSFLGMFIPCSDGKHYLDGQEDEHGNIVGLTKRDENMV